MPDVRTQQAREQAEGIRTLAEVDSEIAACECWLEQHPHLGGFDRADLAAAGRADLRRLLIERQYAERVAALETALRAAVTYIGIDRRHHDHMCTYELVERATEADCDCGYRIVLMYRELAGAAEPPETPTTKEEA